MAVSTTLHIGQPCILRAPSRRRAGGGQARRRPAGWVGRGVLGGWGGGAHCTVLCVLGHTALYCVLHYITCVVPRCMVHAALHGVVLCCTLPVACCATLPTAAHRSALWVTCCSAPFVFRCPVQSAARRTAHVCCALLHCVCWVVPLHPVRAVPHSTALAALHCQGRGWFAQAGAGGGHVTGNSPQSLLVRAHRGGWRTRDRQLALVVADVRTPGREGNAQQAARLGRGWFAHAGTGGGHVTGSSRQSWPVGACRGGRRTRDWQLAMVFAGSRTPRRGEDT